MKVKKFWYLIKRGGIEINENHLSKFLAQIGMASYSLTSNMSTELQFVYKTRNVIEPIIPLRIHETAINFIESGNIDTEILSSGEIDTVVDKLLKTKSIEKKGVLTTLPRLDKPLIQDTRNTSYFFYNNTVVKVTGDGIELLPFEALEGYIWKSQIIQRDVVLMDYEEVVKHSDYYKFFRKITSIKTGDKWESNDHRFNNLMTLNGYLLHSYKDRTNPRAVIFMDDSDKGEPSGRTGKGLIVDGISRIRRTVKEDGKAFQDENRFKYSLVTPDTKILFFDDVKANFNFEYLFSVISEGIMVEPKYINKFFIPFDISPKIVISTNYAVTGQGASNNARRYEFALSDYYSDKRVPVKEFGHLFFEGWDAYQWSLFDSMMMHSVRNYLSRGVIESEKESINHKKLAHETSMKFYRWPDNYGLKLGIKYEKEVLYHDYTRFCDNVPDCDQPTFTKYLKKWAVANSYFVDEPHSGDTRYIRFLPE